jgi:hypothetical protein
VERWRESGLSAEQYASELGINAGTLKFWKYQLGRPAAKTSPVRSRTEVQSKELPLVEVRAAVTTPSATQIEHELSGGRWMRVQAAFEDAALKRLVRVLEELT